MSSMRNEFVASEITQKWIALKRLNQFLVYQKKTHLINSFSIFQAFPGGKRDKIQIILNDGNLASNYYTVQASDATKRNCVTFACH